MGAALRGGVRGLRLVWRSARGPFVFALVLQVIAGLLIGVQLLLAERVIDDLTDSGSEFTISPAFVGVIVVTAVVGLVTAAQPDLLSYVGERVALRSSDGVLEIATRTEPITFEQPWFHDLLDRASVAARSRNADLAVALIGVVGSMFAVVSVLVVLVTIDPWIAPLVALAGLPMVWANSRNSRTYQAFVHRMTEHDRRRTYFWSVLTNRVAARETRAHRVGADLHRRHRRLHEERIVAYRRMTWVRVSRSALGALLSAAVVAVTLVYLANRLDGGSLGTGAVGAAVLGVIALTQRIRSTLSGAGRVYESALFLTDYERLRGLPVGEHHEPERVGPIEELRGEGLTFRYPDAGQTALRDADIIVRRGEVVALVGENGSGKTTLAQLLGGVYPAMGGVLTVDGAQVDPRDLGPHRDRVAFVFQDFVRWALTGRENVALGRLADADDLTGVQDAARRAGVDEFLSAEPDGYETTLSRLFEGGADLSLGQWQRVAIARSIFRDAPIVIFDEPTASLDPVAEQRIFRLLIDEMDDRMVVVVSHRLSSVRMADRIYVLDGGEIVEVGSHQTLLGAGGVYQRLYEAQAQPFTDVASDAT